MAKTQLMQELEIQYALCEREQQLIQEEAKTNPDILLPMPELGEKLCNDRLTMEQIYAGGVDTQIGDVEEEAITYAMHRQDKLKVPRYKQDMAMRMVKVNQVDSDMWNTDFIKGVFLQLNQYQRQKERDAERKKMLEMKKR